MMGTDLLSRGASEWAWKDWEDFRRWEARKGHSRTGVGVGCAVFVWDSDAASHPACVRMSGVVGGGRGGNGG